MAHILNRSNSKIIIIATNSLWRRIRKNRAELFWILLGQGLAFAGSVVSVKVLTNIMPQAAYGELALGMTIAGLMNLFVFGPFGQVILRYYSVSRELNEETAFYSVVVKSLRTTLAVVIAISALVFVLAQIVLNANWAFILLTALVFGIISGFFGVVQSFRTAARERRQVAMAQSADVWLRMIMAAIFVMIMSESGKWALVGYGIATLTLLCLQIASIRRLLEVPQGDQAKLITEKRYAAEFRSYGFPFVFAAGFVAISQYSDRWLLQGMGGEEWVGVYFALSQIAIAPVALVMGVVTQLVVPIAFAKAGALINRRNMESGKALLKFTQLLLSAFFAIATIAAYLWGDLLVGWLTNESYTKYSDALWILVLSQAVFQLGQLLAAEGLSRNNSKIYLWPKAIQSISVVLLGYFLISAYGLWGMAIAGLSASVFYYLATLQANRTLRNQQ